MSSLSKKLTVGVILAISITILTLWLKLDSEACEAYARAEKAGTATQKQLETRSKTRPILWGDVKPGNSFDSYLELAAKIEDLEDRVYALAPNDESGSPVDTWLNLEGEPPKPVMDLIDALQPELALLRLGSQQELAFHKVDWKSELLVENRAWWKLTEFVSLHQLHIKRLLRQGESLEAVRIILDELQLGRDLSRAVVPMPALFGSVAERLALSALVVDINQEREYVPAFQSLSSLDAESLSLLAQGLARADRPMGSVADLVRGGAVIFLWGGQQEMIPNGSDSFIAAAGFELGFSAKWMIADAIERELKLADRLAASAQTWPEIRVIGEAHAEALQNPDNNQFWRMLSPDIIGLESCRRQAMVRIRALRMAVATTQDEELALKDPFGAGTLQSKENGEMTQYWSIGADGIDHHGDPERDVVVEVRR